MTIQKLYIIAGTNEQYLEFVKRKVSDSWNLGIMDVSMSNFIYVRNREQLMGVRDPKGWFIGTWYENPNVIDILNVIVISMTDLNRVNKLNELYRIYNEYQESKVL